MPRFAHHLSGPQPYNLLRSLPYGTVPSFGNPMKRLWLLFSQTCTVLLAGYFVVATLKPQWLGRPPSVAGAIALMEAPALPAGEVPAGSLRGALAAIVLMALRKQAAARYSGPAAFRADLQAWL
ncbi:MAG: hypothetical protein CFE44_20585, partial [Burkholderiales bacterium PBB4]